MALGESGGQRHNRQGASARPLRILAIAPGDPGVSALELVGPHPAVPYALAAGERLAYTILTDEETAKRFAGLPPGHELIVAPLWRLIPRARSLALRPAARLQTGLACLAALFGDIAESPTPRERWDAVHGWGAAGVLPAAAAARALRAPWAWTPPPHAPARDGEDEHAGYAVAWAGGEADLIVAEDAWQARAVRCLWAPARSRLAMLPFGAAAGWDGGPSDPLPATAPHHVAMLIGGGTTAAEMDAALRAVGSVRRLFPVTVIGVGCRQSAAAAAFRAGVRRCDLLSAIAWRDLEPGSPLVDPAGAAAGLGALDAALILGRELAPRRLLAALWRQGTAVLTVGGAAAGDATVAATPALESSEPPALALAALPAEPDAVAAALLARCGERAERWLACRCAWRALWEPRPTSPEALGQALVGAYAGLIQSRAVAEALEDNDPLLIQEAN